MPKKKMQSALSHIWISVLVLYQHDDLFGDFLIFRFSTVTTHLMCTRHSISESLILWNLFHSASTPVYIICFFSFASQLIFFFDISDGIGGGLIQNCSTETCNSLNLLSCMDIIQIPCKMLDLLHFLTDFDSVSHSEGLQKLAPSQRHSPTLKVTATSLKLEKDTRHERRDLVQWNLV